MGVTALAQTPDGYLWLAGRDGLERFDGATFHEVRHDVPGTERALRGLFVRRDGTLLATGGEGLLLFEVPSVLVDWRGMEPGLYQLRGDALESVWFADRLPSPWVWALAEDAAGDLWVGTERGLVRVRGESVEVMTVQQGLPHDFVTALAATPTGLWIGTAGGLAQLVNGQIRTIVRDVPIGGLTTNPTGSRLLVTTQSALFEWSGGVLTPLNVDHVVTATFGLDGALWVARADAVVRLTGPVAGTSVPAVSRVQQVRAMISDREGSLWLATQGDGLIQVRPTNGRRLPALVGHTPFAILRHRDHSMWVTSTAGLDVFGPGQTAPVLRHLPIGPALGTWAPRSLVETPDGRVFVADGDAGVVEIRGTDRVPHHRLRDGKPSAAETLLATRHGDLWVAWTEGGVTRFAGANLDGPGQEIDAPDGLCEGRVGPMIQTADGTVWFGSHEGGLGSWRDGHGRCSTTADGLASNRIAVLHEDQARTLWVGSLDPVGLVRRRGSEFSVLPFDRRTGPGRAFGFAEENGRMWVSTDRGLFVTDKSLLDEGKPRWERYGQDDGLPSEECMSWYGPSLSLDRDGNLWVPTSGGLVIFDPQRRARPAPPPVLLQGVRVAGRRLPPGAPVTMNADDPLEVQFTAPTFRAAERLMFEYQLDPIDSTWTVAGAQRTVLYARVPPGHHTFRVRIVDDVGAALGSAATLAVFVPARPWQRPGVIAAVVLAMAAAVAGAHRLRVRQVAARYGAIQEERARIARDLHDGLAQGFTSVGLHLDALRVTVSDPAANQVVERARSILDRCQAETRTAIWNLRAQTASRISVAEAIERVVRKAAEESGASITFRVDGVPPVADAVAEHEMPLIVQEAITNALRHGRAAHVSVVLTTTEGLQLSIMDDGGGMKAPRPGGFGLTSMRERAARVGGMLAVESAEGEGTEVRLTVPPGGPAA